MTQDKPMFKQFRLVTTMQEDAVRFAVEILERTRDGIVLPYPGSLDHAINGLRHYCLGETVDQ